MNPPTRSVPCCRRCYLQGRPWDMPLNQKPTAPTEVCGVCSAVTEAGLRMDVRIEETQ